MIKVFFPILYLSIFLCGCKNGYFIELSNNSAGEITDCVIQYNWPIRQEYKIQYLTSVPVSISVSTKENSSFILLYNYNKNKYKLEWGCLLPDQNGKEIVRIYGKTVGIKYVSIFGDGETRMESQEIDNSHNID